jgi:PAS domain S-box-containing protein
VLSLKGAFLYVSPSVRRILEYTQEELVGKFIDNITHPSDIVSVTRELKESSSTSSSIPHNKIVSMLFRVRRKHSGYVWLESSGRLHLDQGKGRKVVIMSGRVRPMMPNFMWNAISQCGGLGETEFWCQISSHTGLLISVSSNVHEIMGSKASNMIGRRLIDFVGTRWRASVDQALEEAAMASDQTAPSPSNIPQHTLFNEPRKVECYVCGRNGTEVPVLICFYPLDGPAEPGGPPSPSATGGARVGQNGTAAGRGAIKTASVTCQIRVIPSFTSPSTNRWNSSTSTTSRQLPTSAQLHGAMFQQYGHDRYGTGTTSGSRVANPPSASISSFPPPQLSLQLPSHNLDHYLQARRVHPIVHTLSSPVFEELDTNRSTSWQYELEQIRISNRRMRDEIEALTTVSGTQPDDMRGRR